MTTFCWLPPESERIGASMLGVLTASALNVAPTWSSSFLLLMIPNVENLSSAANDAFSRTVRPAGQGLPYVGPKG